MAEYRFPRTATVTGLPTLQSNDRLWVNFGHRSADTGGVVTDRAPVNHRRQRYGDTFPALIDAARVGSAWAWQSIHGWLAPAVAGYLRMQGADEPDDLTSEVFIGVFKGIGDFVGSEEQFRSWVFVITHRRLIDDRRRRGRHLVAVPPRRESLDDLEGGDAEDEAIAGMSRERVRALCEILVPDQRDVLLLRLIGDLTVEQVADALDKSSGAVKALQHRGLETIRRRISKTGVPL